jgi:hypothetical protein
MGWLAGQRVADGSRSSGSCRHRVENGRRGRARVPVRQGRVRGAARWLSGVAAANTTCMTAPAGARRRGPRNCSGRWRAAVRADMVVFGEADYPSGVAGITVIGYSASVIGK